MLSCTNKTNDSNVKGTFGIDIEDYVTNEDLTKDFTMKVTMPDGVDCASSCS